MFIIEFYSNFDKMMVFFNFFVYNLIKNMEDVKDFFQEIVFRVFINWDKFCFGMNFKVWFFIIMKNIFINNYWKKVKVNMIMDFIDNMYYINLGSVVILNKVEFNIMFKEFI